MNDNDAAACTMKSPRPDAAAAAVRALADPVVPAVRANVALDDARNRCIATAAAIHQYLMTQRLLQAAA